MKIGVFDSGIGGKSVAQRLQELFPEATIQFMNDREHVPYGTRSAEEVIALTTAAIQPLIDGQCDVIVIACNTATTLAIHSLREHFPDTPFVGIEPMVKPAALQTKSGVIAVLATPGTLGSRRYHELKETWASAITVIEPDCSRWAGLIENDHADDVPVEIVCRQLLDQDVDMIVLGCTHYHWLKQRFITAAGDHASILEPSDAIGARVKTVITEALQPPR
jgi:glutamate racemase